MKLFGDLWGGHLQGDFFERFRALAAAGWRFNAGVFHPSCTFLTNSAAWAFKDPDFTKYPGVGYHQKIKPDTLVGAARRAAREEALRDVNKIHDLPIKSKVVENPVGAITKTKRPCHIVQIVHPHDFGDDASKGTVLMLEGLPELPIDPKKRFPPRWVCCGRTLPEGVGKFGCANCNGERAALPRWGNQTNSGQSNVTPSDSRWIDRSRTYPGLADALADHIDRHA